MKQVRVFRHYINIHTVFLCLLDFIALIGAAYIGYGLRFFYAPDLNGHGWFDFLPSALYFALVMLVCMVAMGVYQVKFKEGYIGVTLRASVALFLLGGAMMSASIYLLEEVDLLFGRGVLALAVIAALGLTVGLHFVYHQLVGQQNFLRRVLVLGAGNQAETLSSMIQNLDQEASFSVVGYVAAKGSEDRMVDVLEIPAESSLLNYLVEHNIDEVVVALDERRRSESSSSAFPVEELLDCKQAGKSILDTLSFIEREMGKIEPRSLSASWMLFSDGFNHSALRDYIQRGFDLFASVLLLLLSWPLMLCAIIAIKLEEGLKAPILYSQARVGYGGKVFMVHKFRSMRVDAEKFGAQWAQENDPRVTKTGQFIRNTRIDELPQIFNVIKGEMGFVGPRPERPEFVEQLKEKIPYYDERHRAKPGITGWAQLLYPYGASDEDSEQKLKYDLYYVKNRSLLLDLVILIRTVEVVLVGNGVR